MNWQATPEQLDQFEKCGYFVIHNLVPHDVAVEMRGVIKNTIMLPDPGVSTDADPMDPMGDSPDARAARFRKLSDTCLRSPLIWHNAHAGDAALEVTRYFLGDNLLIKFNSCFLKPALSGSATPWHQDNGLWRDGETDPFNFWMALDPATKQNGCLQFIPGSHKTEIVEHVLYPDSIHGELPRERVKAMITQYGVDHIEVAPGDAVFWHSSLWHYSPPNTSPQGRIAIAGVYSTPEIALRGKRFWKQFHWAMKDGVRCTNFPAEVYEVPEGGAEKPPPYPKVA